MFSDPAEVSLKLKTEGKKVIDKKVYRKATEDSTIVTHMWETED
jgi:hypothetical protein